MPKFRVYAKVVGSKYLGVFEADSAEEALNVAGDSGACDADLCHQCDEECEDPEVTPVSATLVEDEDEDEDEDDG